MNNVMQALSLLGAVLCLVAFVLLQRGRWRSDMPAYLWANLLGATLLTIVGAWDRRLGFVLLEGVWALVSLWSIIRPRRADPAL
jgi:hypothetical protein